MCLLPPSFWLFLWSWELLWTIYHGRELSWLASFAVGPPSRDRRQEALQHAEERRERERRQVTRTRFSIYFSSPHLSPMWVDKPPLCVLLKSPRLRMAGGLRTWVCACWLKAFMHASPWGNTWCWWDRDVCCGEKGWQGKKRWGTWGLGGEDEKRDVCVVL